MQAEACGYNVAANTTSPTHGGLDGGDVDFRHRHHGVECPLGGGTV
jgi:hypothetical protein